MNNGDLYIENLTEGQIIKAHRVAHQLRQIDLASLAKCDQTHIINIERDRWVRPDIREKILVALGLWERYQND